jgi:hypothetical protein
MSFLSKYFSPLDKGACIYFLIISVLFFISLIVVFLAEVFFVFKNYKSVDFKVVSNGVIILFNIFVAYFVNRLLYSMCTKSLA